MLTHALADFFSSTFGFSLTKDEASSGPSIHFMVNYLLCFKDQSLNLYLLGAGC